MWIDNSNNTLDGGFTLTSWNYLSKIVLAKKMVNKINEPCHYEVLYQQSACVKRSCTVFFVMLSNIWVQHQRKYRKWKVSLYKHQKWSPRGVPQKEVFCIATFLRLHFGWVFFCKFAAKLWNTYLEEKLWDCFWTFVSVHNFFSVFTINTKCFLAYFFFPKLFSH